VGREAPRLASAAEEALVTASRRLLIAGSWFRSHHS
jgi:hypothetical protein